MNGLFLLFFFILWLLGVYFFRYYRIWLFYYSFATVGAIYWVVLVANQVLPLDIYLAQLVAWTVHLISNSLGIPTRVFQGAPGVLLVLVVVQRTGWTVLQISIESSGLLEITALIVLLLFYPGWTWLRKLIAILVGALVVWAANILRMLVIVVMLNRLGKDALVLAHTYVGKAIFFFLIIAVFWYLITFPSLQKVKPG